LRAFKPKRKMTRKQMPNLNNSQKLRQLREPNNSVATFTVKRVATL
jgi:hypothetical protein